MTPSMVGVGFAFRWRDRDLYDLYEGMRTTMPQSAPGRSERKHLRRSGRLHPARNGYPGGDTELRNSRVIRHSRLELPEWPVLMATYWRPRPRRRRETRSRAIPV